MEAHEADMMKNTHGLNRWVAAWWYFKVCWLHSRCPFSHYSSFFVCATERCEKRLEEKSHHGSIHTSGTFMHGFRFWHHEDRSTHISLLPCSSSFSFLLLFIVYGCPRIRWQGYFLHFSALDRPSFDLNILDGAEEERFLYPHYLCTDTQSVCMLMIYFMATLVPSHVLSSSEYHETRFLFVKSKRRFMRNRSDFQAEFGGRILDGRWRKKFCENRDWSGNAGWKFLKFLKLKKLEKAVKSIDSCVYPTSSSKYLKISNFPIKYFERRRTNVRYGTSTLHVVVNCLKNSRDLEQEIRISITEWSRKWRNELSLGALQSALSLKIWVNNTSLDQHKLDMNAKT